MSPIGRAGTALFLALLGMGCAAVLYAELADPAAPRLAAVVLPGGPATLQLPELEEPMLAVPPLAAYAPVVERPLFSPSRRPPVVARAVAAAAPVRSDRMILRGVVLSPDRRIALIEIDGAPEPHRIAEGETLHGWTIEAVDAGRIVLRQDGATRQLALRWDASPAPADRRARSRSPLPAGDIAPDDDEAAAAAGTQPEPRLATAIRMLKAATRDNRPLR